MSDPLGITKPIIEINDLRQLNRDPRIGHLNNKTLTVNFGIHMRRRMRDVVRKRGFKSESDLIKFAVRKEIDLQINIEYVPKPKLTVEQQIEKVATKGKYGKTKANIIKLLDREIELNIKNISDRLGLKWSTVDYHVRRLESIGVVQITEIYAPYKNKLVSLI